MTAPRDTELDDVLQDTELMHIADLLGIRTPRCVLTEELVVRFPQRWLIAMVT